MTNLQGSINGYVATFNTKNAAYNSDGTPDSFSFRKGCFNPLPAGLKLYSMPLLNSDRVELGNVTSMSENEKGLKVEIAFTNSKEAQLYRERLKQSNNVYLTIEIDVISTTNSREGIQVSKAAIKDVILTWISYDRSNAIVGTKSLDLQTKANYTQDRATSLQRAQSYQAAGSPGRPAGSTSPQTAFMGVGVPSTGTPEHNKLALRGPQLFTHLIGEPNKIGLQIWRTYDSRKIDSDILRGLMPEPVSKVALRHEDNHEPNSISMLFKKSDLEAVKTYLVIFFIETYEVYDSPVLDVRSINLD